MNDLSLSWATLEEFYPRYSRRAVECRFCCPFAGCAGKKMNRAHESLAVNVTSGVYHCHRCGASGVLDEFVQERRKRDGGVYRRRVTPVFTRLPEPQAERSDWREEICVSELDGSPGVEYLERRGVPVGIAIASNVRYQEIWRRKDGGMYCRPSIVFPVRDIEGRLVAAQARFLVDREGSIRMQSVGSIISGVFAAALAWDQPEWTITEAPIDALSLTYIGVPAMALCGTAIRTWLVEAASEQSRGLILAFDRDKQGGEASEIWAAECRRLGVGFTIIQPGEPAKDWNEQLLLRREMTPISGVEA